MGRGMGRQLVVSGGRMAPAEIGKLLRGRPVRNGRHRIHRHVVGAQVRGHHEVTVVRGHVRTTILGRGGAAHASWRWRHAVGIRRRLRHVPVLHRRRGVRDAVDRRRPQVVRRRKRRHHARRWRGTAIHLTAVVVTGRGPMAWRPAPVVIGPACWAILRYLHGRSSWSDRRGQRGRSYRWCLDGQGSHRASHGHGTRAHHRCL
jgi:hypothetical protein